MRFRITCGANTTQPRLLLALSLTCKCLKLELERSVEVDFESTPMAIPYASDPTFSSSLNEAVGAIEVGYRRRQSHWLSTTAAAAERNAVLTRLQAAPHAQRRRAAVPLEVGSRNPSP